MTHEQLIAQCKNTPVTGEDNIRKYYNDLAQREIEQERLNACWIALSWEAKQIDTKTKATIKAIKDFRSTGTVAKQPSVQ